MDDSKETHLAAKSLKEESNQLYRLKAYKQAINRYDKAIQYLSVFAPSTEEECNLGWQ